MIFTGDNKFVGNTGLFGGSLYLFKSIVTMNGISTFVNNNSSKGELSHNFNCAYAVGGIDYWIRGSGGAIYCKLSTLIINCEYSIFANNSAQDSGGAISAQDGNIIIQGSFSFVNERNVAYEDSGGAMSFSIMTTIILHGDILFVNNEALYGGALSASYGASFSDKEWLSPESFDNSTVENFCWNVATNGQFSESYSHDVNITLLWK